MASMNAVGLFSSTIHYNHILWSNKEGRNMNKPVACLRCHAQMELGFMPDNTQSGFHQQSWYPGTPKASFWTGIKMETDQVVPVVTLRCPNCGYLESYAIPGSISDR